MTRLRIRAMSAMAVALAAAPALAAAEGGEPSPFAGTIYQSIAAILAFLILLLLLRRYAWGPILSGLQERERKIREDLEQAEQAQHQAKQTLEEYERKLAAAHAEARQLIDQARQDAEQLRQRMAGETEQEIARLRQRATDQIEQAKQAALHELYERAGELAIAVAGKILERQITEEDTQRLIDASLNEMEEAAAPGPRKS